MDFEIYSKDLKALSLHPEYATEIAFGQKDVEFRKWQPSYRGDILICSTQHPIKKGTIHGHALCIATLVDCQKLPDSPVYAWILDNIRLIVPVPISGQQRLWNYNISNGEREPLQIIGTNDYLDSLPEEEDDAIFNRFWKPLIV